MASSKIRLGLLMGKVFPTAAPAALLHALESVTVRQRDGVSSFGQGFQITFRAQRTGGAEDYDVVCDRHLQVGGRVIVTAALGARSSVLMDGIITHQQMEPTADGDPHFSVTGQDLSVLMDMVEISRGFPGLGESGIVRLVLLPYAAFGILPKVSKPKADGRALPTERVPFQGETDRQLLIRLAKRHGFAFGIKPGPKPRMSIAHWGEPSRVGLPQRSLMVDMGADTNVRSISFSNDGLAPRQVYGLVHEVDRRVPAPVLTLAATLKPPLVVKPAMVANQPFVRKVRLKPGARKPSEARAMAQAVTNASNEQVVTVEGSLDVLRYQHLLTAPGLVGVKGAGRNNDGLYRVTEVTHSIRRGEYSQNFKLAREGTRSPTRRLPT